MIDFDAYFEEKATDLGCLYVYGAKDKVEQFINDTDISASEGLIMLAPVTIQQIIEEGLIKYNTYSITLGLGRLGLLEDDYLTKHRTTLKELMILLMSFIKSIAGCDSSFTLISSSLQPEINRFSETLDIITATLTLSDE